MRRAQSVGRGRVSCGPDRQMANLCLRRHRLPGFLCACVGLLLGPAAVPLFPTSRRDDRVCFCFRRMCAWLVMTLKKGDF